MLSEQVMNRYEQLLEDYHNGVFVDVGWTSYIVHELRKIDPDADINELYQLAEARYEDQN